MTIYLDNAATTPLCEEVIELITKLNCELYGNPSSLHSIGRKAKKSLKKARAFIAESINADPEEIFFTSGATEANNLVIKNIDWDLIITSPSEHSCVIEATKSTGKEVVWLNLDKQGFVDFKELEEKLQANESKKILVALMHANNEIGTIQDIERIGELCAGFDNVSFLSDCVQTYTKHDLDVQKQKIDFASSSAHKIHGPKGVGFLYCKKEKQELIDSPLIHGGGQESGLRSGTENLIGILAFAEAVKQASKQEHKKKIFEMQKLLIEDLGKLPGFVLNGAELGENRLLGNINCAFTESSLSSEKLLLQLDLKNLCVSSGSACSSNKFDPSAFIDSSYVLRACRLPEEISEKAIRISVSRLNNVEEIKKALEIIRNTVLDFQAQTSSNVLLQSN